MLPGYNYEIKPLKFKKKQTITQLLNKSLLQLVLVSIKKYL